MTLVKPAINFKDELRKLPMIINRERIGEDMKAIVDRPRSENVSFSGLNFDEFMTAIGTYTYFLEKKTNVNNPLTESFFPLFRLIMTQQVPDYDELILNGINPFSMGILAIFELKLPMHKATPYFAGRAWTVIHDDMFKSNTDILSATVKYIVPGTLTTDQDLDLMDATVNFFMVGWKTATQIEVDKDNQSYTVRFAYMPMFFDVNCTLSKEHKKIVGKNFHELDTFVLLAPFDHREDDPALTLYIPFQINVINHEDADAAFWTLCNFTGSILDHMYSKYTNGVQQNDSEIGHLRRFFRDGISEFLFMNNNNHRIPFHAENSFFKRKDHPVNYTDNNSLAMIKVSETANNSIKSFQHSILSSIVNGTQKSINAQHLKMMRENRKIANRTAMDAFRKMGGLEDSGQSAKKAAATRSQQSSAMSTASTAASTHSEVGVMVLDPATGLPVTPAAAANMGVMALQKGPTRAASYQPLMMMPAAALQPAESEQTKKRTKKVSMSQLRKEIIEDHHKSKLKAASYGDAKKIAQKSRVARNVYTTIKYLKTYLDSFLSTEAEFKARQMNTYSEQGRGILFQTPTYPISDEFTLLPYIPLNEEKDKATHKKGFNMSMSTMFMLENDNEWMPLKFSGQVPSEFTIPCHWTDRIKTINNSPNDWYFWSDLTYLNIFTNDPDVIFRINFSMVIVGTHTTSLGPQKFVKVYDCCDKPFWNRPGLLRSKDSNNKKSTIYRPRDGSLSVTCNMELIQFPNLRYIQTQLGTLDAKNFSVLIVPDIWMFPSKPKEEIAIYWDLRMIGRQQLSSQHPTSHIFSTFTRRKRLQSLRRYHDTKAVYSFDSLHRQLNGDHTAGKARSLTAMIREMKKHKNKSI